MVLADPRLVEPQPIEVLDQVEESEFGCFGWVMDPEGNKVELWQLNREPIN